MAEGGTEDVCRLNNAGKLFSCYIDGCCLHSHNEDVADSQTEIAHNPSGERSVQRVFLLPRLIAYKTLDKKSLTAYTVILSRQC